MFKDLKKIDQMLKHLCPVFLCLLTCFFISSTVNASVDIQQTAQEVLAKLYAAHGDETCLLPRVRVTNSTTFGASFRKRNNEIVLEEKVYNICRSFKQDSLQALAFILGHELAHAFQEVGGSNFLAAHVHEETGHQKEQEADIFGVFVSYQAGYKNYKILPRIIEEIYQSYDLIGKKMESYPSYEDRKATCKEVLEITEKLVDLFDAANYLSVIGQYHLAIGCYEFIEQHYRGKEIYNNIGMNYALKALNFTTANIEEYLFPFEIDVNTRLRKQQIDLEGRGLTPAQQLERINYLNLAEQYCARAGKVAPNYLIADLNLLCVLALNEKYQSVIEYSQYLLKKNKLLQQSKNKGIKAKLRTVLAIAFAKTAKKEKAIRIFEDIKFDFPNTSIGNMVTYNLNVLLNNKHSNSIKTKTDCSLSIETPKQIDNIRLHRPFFDQEIILSDNDDLMVSIVKKENSLNYFFKEKGLPRFSLQRVLKKNKSLKISNKSIPIQHSTAGSFITCKEENLVFYFNDQKAKMIEWGKYFDFSN